MAKVLWVGGSSALARSYFDEVHPVHRQHLQLIAAAPTPPTWPLPDDVAFVELDMASEASVRTLFLRLPTGIDAIIFGVRASLVWGRPEEHETLSKHLDLLLHSAAAAGCTSVLHISSIAVTDHVATQRMIRETDETPPIEQIQSPYDRFKLRSEHVIDAACASEPKFNVWTHLRISGIFSNDPRCIQCTAVRQQALVSLAAEACIDFNSSRNVGYAMALVLERMLEADEAFSGRRLYYYTRCTPEPTPYWRHVSDFRRANAIWYGLWIPSWVGDICVPPMRRVARAVGTALATSLDYLMAVATHEHSADNSLFRSEFPQLATCEESILECFQRLRLRHEEQRSSASVAGRNALPRLSALFLLLLLLPLLLVLAFATTPPPPPPPPPPWWALSW